MKERKEEGRKMGRKKSGAGREKGREREREICFFLFFVHRNTHIHKRS
jgi:hypothetical protein